MTTARVADWLGDSSGVTLVSYALGATVALAAVAAVTAVRRAAVACRHARARWEPPGVKRRVRFIYPEQDSKLELIDTYVSASPYRTP